jgi:hypothetical protein
MKLIRKIGFTIIIAIVAFLLLQQLNWLPNISKWFKSKPVLIENTPLIVESIKDLKEIITITSNDEVVVYKQELNDGTLLGNIINNGPINPNDKRLGLLLKGTIQAGIDLSQLQEKDIIVNKDSVLISLPPTSILSTIINPSDTEILLEEGKWALTEVNKAKVDGRDNMIAKAKEKGILIKAETRARVVVEGFLRSIGFKKISIVTTQ